MLCAAKFSVKHTAELLQEHKEPTEAPDYAELETTLEDTVAAPTGDPMPDVSIASFKMLPLDAQIQVMQEKAAHRLLAQTLHQQMLEELHKNPWLASDADQQVQFKLLAQQQLLYQMALAAQVSKPRDGVQACATAHTAAEMQHDGIHHGAMHQAFELTGMEPTESMSWGSLHCSGGSAWVPESHRHGNDEVLNETISGMSSGSGPRDSESIMSNDQMGVDHLHDGDFSTNMQDFHAKPRGSSMTSEDHLKCSKTAKRTPHRKVDGVSLKRVKLQLAGSVHQGCTLSMLSSAMPLTSVAVPEPELMHQTTHDVGESGAKVLSKRRAWLNSEEQAAMKFPQSAASARLLKQLADFNPSGKDDSAPNVLLPNEHEAKERGISWRLQTDGDGSMMLGVHHASFHDASSQCTADSGCGMVDMALNETIRQPQGRAGLTDSPVEDGGLQLRRCTLARGEASHEPERRREGIAVESHLV